MWRWWFHGTRWALNGTRRSLCTLAIVAGGIALAKDACTLPPVCEEHPTLDACGG